MSVINRNTSSHEVFDSDSDLEIYSPFYSSDEEELSSPIKTLNIHDIIIAVAKAMGYKSDENGVCNGISSMGMRAAMLRKEGFFNRRIEDITQLFHKHLMIYDPLNTLAKSPDKLFSEDNQIALAIFQAVEQEISGNLVLLNDLLPFFDGIELFQQMKLDPDLFEKGKAPSYPEDLQSLDALLSMITPDGMESTKVCEIARSSDVYLSGDDLVAYLKELKEVFENSSIDTPVGIKLGNIGHMQSIVYEPRGKHWLVIDPNYLPIYELEDEESVQEVLSSGFKENSSILTSHIYTFEGASEPLKTNLKAYFKRKTHTKVTDEKAVFLDAKGNTWLHQAAIIGYESLASSLSLLDEGAQADLPNNIGSTPMDYALICGHSNIVGILLTAGAKINLEKFKDYPLLYKAAEKSDLEMIKILLKAGIDVNLQDDNDSTALHIAAEKGDLETVLLLLKKGASDEIQDDRGNTPLHLATLFPNSL